MEFGQLQLNYMDWHFQNAQEKVEILQEAGIPIWVMEPLRGGKLAKASGEVAAGSPVDTISGASYSSGAVFDAVNSAMTCFNQEIKGVE